MAALLFAATATLAHAQNYSSDWFKIAGGGLTSTGGLFTVSDTIGQPDAGGPMTNGPYDAAARMRPRCPRPGRATLSRG